MDLLKAILLFWFGEMEQPNDFPTEKMEVWFGGGAEVDRDIKTRFEAYLPKAFSGDYDKFLGDPSACIALIVLLDQFPRNIYRNQPEFVQYDSKALKIAKYGVENGFDQKLSLAERIFFYLPFEHSEQMEDQEISVRLFTQLLEDAPKEQKKIFESTLQYAVDHYEVIKDFGRFPHRNKILGRESTDKELKLLEAGGSFF